MNYREQTTQANVDVLIKRDYGMLCASLAGTINPSLCVSNQLCLSPSSETLLQVIIPCNVAEQLSCDCSEALTSLKWQISSADMTNVLILTRVA